MWGLTIRPLLWPLARRLPHLCDLLGMGAQGVPFTGTQPYVLTARPQDNLLTSDPEMFNWFREHLLRHPELALGAPTMRWLSEAMQEFTCFERSPPPDLPCAIHLGTREAIVSPEAIRRLAARWPGATLTLHDGAQHEVLMERPAIREAVLDQFLDTLP